MGIIIYWQEFVDPVSYTTGIGSCKMMFPISYLVYSVNYLVCLLITRTNHWQSQWRIHTTRHYALGPRLSMDHKSLPTVVCLLLTQLLSLVGWGFESVKGSSMWLSLSYLRSRGFLNTTTSSVSRPIVTACSSTYQYSDLYLSWGLKGHWTASFYFNNNEE